MAWSTKLMHVEKVEVVVGERIDNGMAPSIPPARSGHRIVADSSNLYSIGGYNPKYFGPTQEEQQAFPLFEELWKFNFVTRKWNRMRTTGNMPKQMASHTAVLQGRDLLVFGGTGIPFGDCSSNQLHICNLDSMLWRSYSLAKGQLPEKAYGHTMTVLGTKLYIVGGTSGYVYNSDVHRLDICTGNWKKLKPSMEPSGRYRHETVCYGKRLYMLGGGTISEVHSFEKLPVYDLESEEWIEITTKSCDTKGFPIARKCHSCVQLESDAFMCGGLNKTTILGDIWKLSLISHQWSCFDDSLPAPVYFHSAAITSEGCMYVFGGITEVDIERTNDIYKIWIKIPSLKQLSWHSFFLHVKHIDRIDRTLLLEAGVPQEYVELIS